MSKNYVKWTTEFPETIAHSNPTFLLLLPTGHPNIFMVFIFNRWVKRGDLTVTTIFLPEISSSFNAVHFFQNDNFSFCKKL